MPRERRFSKVVQVRFAEQPLSKGHTIEEPSANREAMWFEYGRHWLVKPPH